MFLAFNPALLRAMIELHLQLRGSPDWPYPFAAHDLGTYPKANGQTYRGFDKNKNQDIIETQMPVEECGNMPDPHRGPRARRERRQLCQAQLGAADKLGRVPRSDGLDPGATVHRRFLRRPAHNVNLSAKAAMGSRATPCWRR